MFFGDDEACCSWVAGIGLDAQAIADVFATGGAGSELREPLYLYFDGIEFHRLLCLSEVLYDTLFCESSSDILLWVRGWGIWPSAENRHCYYRLRNSYGEASQLKEKPGHFFMACERPDAVTFVHLCLLFGWDAYLVARPSRTVISISHDGWVGFDTELRGEVTALLERAGFVL